MPIIDIVSAALSGPAGRVVEGPVRAIVNEVLQDRGYASPAEVQALRDDLARLTDTVTRLGAELTDLRTQADGLSTQVDGLRQQLAAAPAPQAAPEPEAAPAASKAPAPASKADRLGMSIDDYERWRSGGLPGVIGPDGYVDIKGTTWRVNAALEGQPYTLSAHKNPRVQVKGRPVAKTRVG
ncbi:MAG: DUF3053 domain-containing protein [Oligoflexia bacterium]|nr:DUF3053 domain-containing protein [Oligoflexia bacterium]